MKFRAHRGGVYYTPENTLPAFKNAIDKGYLYLETDPRLTKDNVIVLMHDETINRTCKNMDGTSIKTPIKIADLTYNELLRYDAGVGFDKNFKNTPIPRLDELFDVVKDKDINVMLDKTIATDKIDLLIDLVIKHNAKVSFSVSDVDRIQKIQKRLPNAKFDYDVNTEDELLAKVCDIVSPENLTVWLYLDKPNYAWLKQSAKVTLENVERVKKYAKLGIGNVNTPTDVKEALDFLPDIIEL